MVTTVRANTLKDKLAKGETAIGVYLRQADPCLAEVLGYMGWDYLFFDGEHCPLSGREAEHLARVCELTGVTPVARVAANQAHMIGTFLDAGIQAVQIPMIATAAQALGAAQAALYPPLGTRGVAATRPARYAQVQPFHLPDYLAAANAETLVIVQIETREGVANARAIAATPGVDVVFIGPNDLSTSLGHPGALDHPEVQRAFEEVAGAVREAGKTLGIMVNNLEQARAWKQRGVRYQMIVLEAVIGPAIREFTRAVHDA